MSFEQRDELADYLASLELEPFRHVTHPDYDSLLGNITSAIAARRPVSVGIVFDF